MCTPPATALRLSDAGALLQEMTTNVYVLYSPKIRTAEEKAGTSKVRAGNAVPAELLAKSILEISVEGVSNYQRNRPSS